MARRQVVIFAGAGASKAVNSAKFPTTVEFFEQLPPEIREQMLFQRVVDAVTDGRADEIVDIEKVLWALQQFRDFFRDLVNNSSIVAKLIAQYNVIPQLVQDHGIGQLAIAAPAMISKIDGLISEINTVVYELYGYEPSVDEVSRNWVELIARLSKFDANLDIFTTNYDIVVEASVQAALPSLNEHDYMGLRPGRYRMLDLTAWATDSRPRELLLTKLHGSVDWKMNRNGIYVGDPTFTGDHKRHAIIYPGFKGKSEITFFDAFHDYLSDRLARADVAIFVGFAFRDDYINELIREQISQSAQVLVINPSKVEFPSRRARVRYVQTGFDESSVELARILVEKTLSRGRVSMV